MSAVLECTGRSVAVRDAKAFCGAIEKASISTVAEALPDALSFTETFNRAEGLADARRDTIADPEAFRDPKAFSDTKAFRDTKAFSITKA